MDSKDRENTENNVSREQGDQEEILLRITAHYVEKVQAGQQPDINDYLTRYPQYADAMMSFIAYYQTVELPLSQLQMNSGSAEDIDDAGETEQSNSEDESANVFRIALESAWHRVMSLEQVSEFEGNAHGASSADRRDVDYSSEIDNIGVGAPGSHGQTIQSLFLVAKQQRLSLSQLAAHLNVSEDIISLLIQQAIVPESIPLELYRRLAATLRQPGRTIRRSIDMERRQRVAEHPGVYAVENTLEISPKVSFREALENSGTVSAEQMQFWYGVFTEEGL